MPIGHLESRHPDFLARVATVGCGLQQSTRHTSDPQLEGNSPRDSPEWDRPRRCCGPASSSLMHRCVIEPLKSRPAPDTLTDKQTTERPARRRDQKRPLVVHPVSASYILAVYCWTGVSSSSIIPVRSLLEQASPYAPVGWPELALGVYFHVLSDSSSRFFASTIAQDWMLRALRHGRGMQRASASRRWRE